MVYIKCQNGNGIYPMTTALEIGGVENAIVKINYGGIIPTVAVYSTHSRAKEVLAELADEIANCTTPNMVFQMPAND